MPATTTNLFRVLGLQDRSRTGSSRKAIWERFKPSRGR
jgi:hypothetical protein